MENAERLIPGFPILHASVEELRGSLQHGFQLLPLGFVPSVQLWYTVIVHPSCPEDDLGFLPMGEKEEGLPLATATQEWPTIESGLWRRRYGGGEVGPVSQTNSGRRR
jgi:hypothetical protein